MALKNYTSKSTQTFDRIQKALATHGANKVMFDYAGNGMIQGMAFQIVVSEQPLSIKLPAKIDNVAVIMYGKTFAGLSEEKQQQVYRTAWANIRDWIEAQMAMIDTDMVRMEEIFLPYLVTRSGQTLFEQIQGNNFLLPSPSSDN